MTGQQQGPPWQGQPDPAALQARITELEKLVAEVAGLGLNGSGQPASSEVAEKVARLGAEAWLKRQGDRWADDAERSASLADVPDRPGQRLADFLATAPEEPDFEIRGLVPKQSRVIFTGEEGAGKSTLLRFMAVRHAAGIHPFRGEPYDGGTCVLLDCENPVGLQQMRLAELAESLGRDAAAQAGEKLVAEAQPGGIDLASPWWQEYVLRLVDRWKATLLVIGPLYKLCSLKPMSEEFFVTISEFLDRLRTQHGCAQLIETHCRQPAAGQIGRDMFPYGNTGWRRWPEAGMHLGRSGVLTDWRGNRYGADVSWPLRLDRVPGSQVLWRAEYSLAGNGAAGAAVEAEKFQAIRAAITEDPGISMRRLRAAISDDGSWIRKAVQAGAIIEHRAGKDSGRSNRYEAVAGWTGAQPSWMLDGHLSFQQMYEIADHSAMVDES